MTEKVNKEGQEFMKDLLISYASIGDLKNVKILIEEKGLGVNTTKYNLTPLSVCSAKSGDIQVIQYLLSKGAAINDSLFHAIKAGNVETVELLLSRLSANDEIKPVANSSVFPPYFTPIILASICGNRCLIELFLLRGHRIPNPHLADCECDDCNVSATRVPTPSQRNLDIYRAMCNPAYIGLKAKDRISEAFRLERESRFAIEKSCHFSHHYKEVFRQMEHYVTDIMGMTRDAEEVKILVMQKGVQPRPNAFIKYVVLQNAVDNHWVEFVASKQMESLRSHLWLGHNKVWLHSGMSGLLYKFGLSLAIIFGQLWLGLSLIIRYRKHITAQARYLCRVFNESFFAFVLFYYLTQTSATDRKWSFVVKVLITVWTLGNIVNITKKSAIFGLKKLWQFYGHVFEIVITFEMSLIISLAFLCDETYAKSATSEQDSDTSTCAELKHVLMRLLVKLIYIRLVIISSIRAYKGSEGQPVIRLSLLAFCLISTLYPVFSNVIANQYNMSAFDATLGINMFGDVDPLFVFIVINFLIALIFEIVRGPEKILDKNWCFHWTALLIYEIHGACELAVPFNLFETHRVLFILLKRVGFKERINEKDVKQYEHIKSLVYSRYDCIKYLESKPCCTHHSKSTSI